MLRVCLAVLVVGSVVATSTAAPYSIFYSGDDFPENEGWSRAVFDEPGGPGAIRSLDNGVFTIDSMRSASIEDSYSIRRALNPAIGETFAAEWRMRVRSHSGFRSDIFGIARDQQGLLVFGVDGGAIYSSLEGISAPFVPGLFHTFRLVSSDMVSYTLFIDNALALSGHWEPRALGSSLLAWGDLSSGAGTVSVLDWDFVSVQVVPEPVGMGALGIVFGSLIYWRRRW
ncbi:MAG: hypothetical protein IPM64_09595 [Phycisphaerales bacterium]|nr:hypothetical protein [Phycisphaerales bacterium]